MNESVGHSAKLFLMLALALLAAPTVAGAQHYIETDLVSNSATPPVVNDPNLQNAWGLVHGPATPWWISNNAAGTSTVYNASTIPVVVASLVVTVPGHPTSVMFNGSTTDFLLAPGKQATFIWATEDGTISGWNPGVDATNAVIMVDRSGKNGRDGAVYKGATIAEIGEHKYILAANFHSGKIEVFDSSFKRVRISHDAFDDDRLPPRYGPFNIQAIGPNIYVSYAKQDDMRHDDQPGDGFGYVDVFSTEGKLVARLQHGPWLNAPWGMVLTPAYFGTFSHTLLVANFGSGSIAAFNALTGRFLGNLLNPDGSMLIIDGLWGLGFGNGGASGPGNTLFFTAGPNDETNGLFGSLTPVAAELAGNVE
jgi:uncharacterized protein (TIGR03118 family)